MLRYNIENPDPGHLAIIIDAPGGDADGQQIAAVRTAKEQPRALPALRITATHVTQPPAPSRTSPPPSAPGAQTTQASPS
jgi:hypothetical protein